MKSVWPFGFFPAKSSDKEAEIIEEVKQEVIEDEVKASLDSDTEELPPDEVDTFDEESDESDDYDFEIEWDYLVESEEEIEEKKKTRKKVIIGLSVLGAAGLATGFALRSFLKNR